MDGRLVLLAVVAAVFAFGLSPVLFDSVRAWIRARGMAFPVLGYVFAATGTIIALVFTLFPELVSRPGAELPLLWALVLPGLGVGLVTLHQMAMDVPKGD